MLSVIIIFIGSRLDYMFYFVIHHASDEQIIFTIEGLLISIKIYFK